MRPLPEYIKVRTYLFNFAMKNRTKGSKIPSENELSAMFGVSRVTVRGAIKGLIGDRLLFSKRGMGTYINPEYAKEINFRAIGMLVGSGGHSADQFSPPISEAIRMCGLSPEILFVPDSNQPDRLVEVARLLDGIIWEVYNQSANPYLAPLRESGIPLLLLQLNNHCPTGFDTLKRSPSAIGSLLAETFQAHGHRRILFITRESDNDYYLQPGTTYHQLYFQIRGQSPPDREAGKEDLYHIAEFARLAAQPDFLETYTAIYSTNYLVSEVMSILDRAKIQVPEQLSYLVFGESLPIFFHGLQPAYLSYHSSMLQSIAEWICCRILNRDMTGAFSQELITSFFPGTTLRKLN